LKSSFFIILVGFVLFVSCNKESETPSVPVTPLPVVIDTVLKCGNLPLAPKTFGWQDTLGDEEKNVKAFVYSPLDPDQLIYLVNGTIFGGFNKLYSYNIPTKQSVFLGFNLNYLPQVNKRGWIVYSDVNNDIFKIKINGDSAIQLSNNQVSDNPRWDHSGNFIYFFQKAKNNVSSQIIRMTKEGVFSTSFFADLPHIASFNKSDKIIYLKVINNTRVTMVLKDMADPNETDLINGPLESIAGRVNFDNLCVDKDDENIIWSNSNGIFSCNISTLKIDTLFKNCENFLYDNPIFSFKDNELYYNHHIKKPLSKYKLLHIYKSMELNLLSKQISEVKIFP
jgi:hypothetical protein